MIKQFLCFLYLFSMTSMYIQTANQKAILCSPKINPVVEKLLESAQNEAKKSEFRAQRFFAQLPQYKKNATPSTLDFLRQEAEDIEKIASNQFSCPAQTAAFEESCKREFLKSQFRLEQAKKRHARFLKEAQITEHFLSYFQQ